MRIQARYPKLVIEISEPEDVKSLIESAVSLMEQGVKFKASELRSKLKFSDPAPEDEVAGGLREPGPATNRQKIAMNREIPTRDAIDEIEDEMMADWQEVADGVLGAVESVIEAAESYDDLLARLPETLRHMPTALVVDTLVKGMFKARTTGDQKDG